MIMLTELLLTLLVLSPLLLIKDRKPIIIEKRYTSKELQHIAQQMTDCSNLFNKQRNRRARARRKANEG